MTSRHRYQIVVIGGGLAGCAAAVSGARLRRRTVLIERYGFLGGWATAALVNPFMSHCTSDGKPLVGGVFDEIRRGLDEAGGLLENSFDAECMKFVLQELVSASGVELRLHTCFESARHAEDEGIVVGTLGKGGLEEIECERLVDCSGDGDAAVALGADFETGGDDGGPQAMTLMFDVGGVDLERALDYVRDHPNQMRFPKLAPDANPRELAEGVVSVAGYYDLVAEARKKGDYDVPGDMIFYVGRPRKGEVVFNTTHVGGVNGTKPEDLTRAEIEGRRQMMSVVAFVRKYVPGFEDAYLLRSPVSIGVRESRRVVGEYVFSAEDVVGAAKFEDAICRLAYPVDVHCGRGEGYLKSEEPIEQNGPKAGDWYEIPYRCLLPVGVENVLVAGRCVSSTQAGHGAIRIMPCCVAMGQAAGAAAALSIRSGRSPREIDVSALLNELRSQGALV